MKLKAENLSKLSPSEVQGIEIDKQSNVSKARSIVNKFKRN